MRCAVHNLAAGPDGRCVVCRRAEKGARAPRVDASPPRPASPALAVVKALFVLAGAFVLVAGGAVAARATSRATTREAVASPAARRRPPPIRRPGVRPAPVVRDDDRATRGLPRGGASPEVVSPLDEPSYAPPPRAARDHDDARALRDAYARVSVTIYTTTWCGYCKRAKRWLDGHGVAYFERDVEQDPEAQRRARALSGGTGVPVINVEGEVLRGFDERALQRAVDRAARRHLRPD